MIIFVPRETKSHEYRVGLLPAGARALNQDGHQVWIERGAGEGSGLTDSEYVQAGATIIESAAEGYGVAELVVKVKEPLPLETPLLRSGQLVFCYFHFAASKSLTRDVLASGATALAYETLMDDAGRLPLLVPMSEVAGRMSIQQGAKALENPSGGRGVLLGGVPGVAPGHVTILGAGVVGTEAAKMAAGLGARVHLLDTNVARLRELSATLPANVVQLFSDRSSILQELARADLVIGAVLIRGARAPRLITREDLALMKKGSVIVDVAIDQGGCTETSRPTSHLHPTYEEEGIVHSCVPNIPGAVSRTSTFALCNVTLPYVRLLANHGYEGACQARPFFASALNIQAGKIVDSAVAEAYQSAD